jgi:hypothetical protein
MTSSEARFLLLAARQPCPSRRASERTGLRGIYFSASNRDIDERRDVEFAFLASLGYADFFETIMQPEMIPEKQPGNSQRSTTINDSDCPAAKREAGIMRSPGPIRTPVLRRLLL